MDALLPALAYHPGSGWVDWLAHTVVSSIVHGLIFAFVLKLMHGLTLTQAGLLVVVVLVVLFAWGAGRDRRRW